MTWSWLLRLALLHPLSSVWRSLPRCVDGFYRKLVRMSFARFEALWEEVGTLFLGDQGDQDFSRPGPRGGRATGSAAEPRGYKGGAVLPADEGPTPCALSHERI